MFRGCLRLRCAAEGLSTSPPDSLKSWLRRLTMTVAELPFHNRASAMDGTCETLWRDLERLALHAHNMKETDCVLALTNELCRKGYFPTHTLSQPSPWATLAERLLVFANAEATQVLMYPGTPDAQLRAQHRSEPFDVTYHLPCSRETLLLTGGVAPRSALTPCETGEALSTFLSHWCDYLELCRPIDVAAEVSRMNPTVVRILKANMDHIVFEAIADVFARYCAILYHQDAGDSAGVTAGTKQGLEEPSSPKTDLLLPFARELCTTVTGQALGARLTALGLGYIIEETRLKALRDAGHVGTSVGMQHLLSSQQFFRESQKAQVLQLQLVRVACRALSQHYERTNKSKVSNSTSLVTENNVPACVYGNISLAPLLESFCTFTDAVFQYNSTHGNALELSDGFVEAVRGELSLATLRALRVEATAPDQFLRKSMEVVDRCVPSMVVEAELIAGKVALFDVFELNEESKATLYDDIVTSLRNLVELRPQPLLNGSGVAAGNDRPHDTADGGMQGPMGEGNSAEYNDQDTLSIEGGTLVGSAGLSGMDAAHQAIMQTAHEQVIRVLCDSHDTARMDEAYGIVVAHKYHGLIVTKDVIRPLMASMCRRGDCRVFNLVDLCVLYNNSVVDMDSVACLFRACAVAGDYYRARTLLQLLEDVVPGFLIKAPQEIKESLKELKVLPPEPFHLFTSEEEKLVKAAVAGGTGLASPSTEPRRLPN